jgi:hypothetical protein
VKALVRQLVGDAVGANEIESMKLFPRQPDVVDVVQLVGMTSRDTSPSNPPLSMPEEMKKVHSGYS